jgi:putative SOS response-associated peptidase YedK
MDFMLFDDGCGRYTLKAKSGDLKKRYNLAKVPKDTPVSYDVKPGQTLPVVSALEDGDHQLEMMRWGLVPSWSKDPKIGYKTFNARDDKVFESGMWRSIYRRRVLVPATGYFEWTKPTKESGKAKQKYFFRPKDLDIFSFAGFYDVWKDAEDKEWKTYTLITTEPNKEARAIHDRMPVILHPEDEASWIEPSRTKREDLEPLLHPLEDNGLEVVEVNSDVSDWAFDDERRISALNSQ